MKCCNNIVIRIWTNFIKCHRFVSYLAVVTEKVISHTSECNILYITGLQYVLVFFFNHMKNGKAMLSLKIPGQLWDFGKGVNGSKCLQLLL